MNDPGKFVSKKQKPKQHGPCGKDCWLECDDFKTSGPHDFCPHCDDLDCTTCQCCRGWCDMPSRSLEPSPAKFIRLAFHDCLKYVEDTHTLKCLVNLQGIINLQALNNKIFLQFFVLMKMFTKKSIVLIYLKVKSTAAHQSAF